MTDRPVIPTRMLFMGSAALTDGFQLIGFETWPDATPDQLNEVLETLVENRENAFVIIDHDLAKQECPMLDRVRREGGRIVVTEVPPLNDPVNFSGIIDTRVQALLGESDRQGQR